MDGWLNLEFVLVASANLGKAFQKHSRRSSSGSNLFLFIGVAIGIVLLLAGLYFWDRRKSKTKVETDTELILFRRLCKLHNLTAAETSLLERLASSRNLVRRSDLVRQPQTSWHHVAGPVNWRRNTRRFTRSCSGNRRRFYPRVFA